MKIVISSAGDNLSAQVDPRFGRCSFFVMVETEDMSFESFNNESIALSGGAGIESATFVASQGVEAVLTGNCGPKAMQVFNTADVKVFTGLSGTIAEVVEKFKQGSVNQTTTATVAEKAGVSGGLSGAPSGSQGGADVQPRNMGQGTGSGRGMGGGGGRGMGGGGRCQGGSGRGLGLGGGIGRGLSSGGAMGSGGGKSAGSNVAAPAPEPSASTQGQPEETITVHANIDITITALQAIVSNAKEAASQKGENPTRVDTADKVSEMISNFLHEKDFQSYATNIENY